MACPEIPAPSSPLTIRLPGPIEIAGAPLSSLPSQSEVARALFGQVGAALGPFAAVFKLIEAAQAILAVAEAVPKALIGFPPEPGKILEELPRLRQAVGDLVSLLPQAALPLMLKDTVAALNAYIAGVIEELDALAETQARADAATATAAALDPVVYASAIASLTATAACLSEQIGKRIVGIEAASTPVNSTIGILNSLLAAINLPQIPTVSNLGTDIDGARTTLQTLSDALDVIG